VADRVDVIDADPRSGSRAVVVAAALLLTVVAAGTALRDRSPAPLLIRLEQLDGSALRDESFVRLHVQFEAEGASGLVAEDLLPTGSLAVQVRDSEGQRRLVELPVPTEGQLERLVRYRCR